jgi:hypothetical protein
MQGRGQSSHPGAAEVPAAGGAGRRGAAGARGGGDGVVVRALGLSGLGLALALGVLGGRTLGW